MTHSTSTQQSFWQQLLPQKTEKWWNICLILVVATGFYFRVLYIQQPAGNDEAYSWLAFIRLPFVRMITDYSHPNNHIFHTLLAGASTRLFGSAVWTIRLPAFIAGVLMIPFAYLAGRKWYNPAAGLLAAAFVAASPNFLSYSAQARGYSILTLITLIMLWLGHGLIRQFNLPAWIIFTISGVLGAYTIPIMIYPLAAIYVWIFFEILIENRKTAGWQKNLFPVLISAVAVIIGTVILYSPVIFWGTGLKSLISNGEVVSQPWQEFLTNLRVRLLRTWDEWNDHFSGFFTVITLIGFFASIFLHRIVARHRIHLAAASLVGFGLVLLLHRVAPYTRIWAFALAWFYLVSAGGWAALIQLLVGKGNLAYVLILTTLAAYPLLEIGVAIQGAKFKDVTATGVEEETARYLAQNLADGEQVLGVIPFNTQVKFYFSLMGDYERWFYNTAKPTPFDDAIVIVATKYDQTLETVLERNQVQEQVDSKQAELIHTYKHVEVYRVPSAGGLP